MSQIQGIYQGKIDQRWKGSDRSMGNKESLGNLGQAAQAIQIADGRTGSTTINKQIFRAGTARVIAAEIVNICLAAE